MIQTRGRARKAGSRYIILADRGQIELQTRLRNQEYLLDIVIGATTYGPSPHAEQIFQRLQKDPELKEVQVERQLRVLSSGRDDVGFFVFVQV